MSNRGMKIALSLMMILILASVGIIIGIKKYREHQAYQATLPTFNLIEMNEYYDHLEDAEPMVIYNDKIMDLEHLPVVKEEDIYLPISFVIDELNDKFYWDSEESTLTYTTANEVIRMKTNDLTYYVNSEPLELNMPITYLEDGVAYMPSSLLLQFSQYEFAYNKAYDILMIEDPERDVEYATVIGTEVALRTKKDDQSAYIKFVGSGEEVRVIEKGETWTKIRTNDGLFGYVENVNLHGYITRFGTREPLQIPEYPRHANTYDGKLNLVWHQVSNVTANQYVEKAMEGVHSVDVLSPTWFEIKDSEGNITNIADINYVNWAHERGYQVWALFKCFDYDHTHDVLSSTEKREKVIKQILAYASLYNLDGINIDFETIRKEDGKYFVQFMKEMSPYMKKQGLIFSVDMYVPSSWTAHYNRVEVGKVVDYLMVMTYDEHWSTSPESGPVASIGFVDNGVKNTLKEVPKEKVIQGLPYYVRIWKEEPSDGGVKVTSKAYGMNKAYNTMIENGAEFDWDEKTGQYYAEYKKGNSRYRMWLEDERSIEEKVKVMEKYDIAGVAGWKLSLEKDEVWDVLKDYLK